jgi:hypothetical protein
MFIYTYTEETKGDLDRWNLYLACPHDKPHNHRHKSDLARHKARISRSDEDRRKARSSPAGPSPGRAQANPSLAAPQQQQERWRHHGPGKRTRRVGWLVAPKSSLANHARAAVGVSPHSAAPPHIVRAASDGRRSPAGRRGRRRSSSPTARRHV